MNLDRREPERHYLVVAVAAFAVAALAFFVLACYGCSTSPVTGQHPGWACASSYAGPLGAGIASLITMNPTAIITATSIAVSGCQAEASLVAGPPAQTTTITTTQTALSAGPIASPSATATPSIARPSSAASP